MIKFSLNDDIQSKLNSYFGTEHFEFFVSSITSGSFVSDGQTISGVFHENGHIQFWRDDTKWGVINIKFYKKQKILNFKTIQNRQKY